MAYSERDGQVVLTMSKADYSLLMLALGHLGRIMSPLFGWIELINRLNEGNPDYTPYRRKESDASSRR